MRENKKSIRSAQVCVVTLTRHAVTHKLMLDRVLEELNTGVIVPAKVCFAIPAHSLNKENKNAKRFVRTLREFGCKFCLSEFGQDATGQDAIKQPAEYVALDNELVKKIVDDTAAESMLKSINDIAHMMDKQSMVTLRLQNAVFEKLNEMKIDYLSNEQTAELRALSLEATEALA